VAVIDAGWRVDPDEPSPPPGGWVTLALDVQALGFRKIQTEAAIFFHINY
jgi:hypothetical protein